MHPAASSSLYRSHQINAHLADLGHPDIMLDSTVTDRSCQSIMEKELTDRATAIHERITQLRDSL